MQTLLQGGRTGEEMTGVYKQHKHHHFPESKGKLFPHVTLLSGATQPAQEQFTTSLKF